MPKGIKISEEIKNKVLKRIKEDGLSGNKAALEAGIDTKAVYRWLKEETEDSGVSWHEYNRTKRENQQLKEIIGHLTLEMHKPKKS